MPYTAVMLQNVENWNSFVTVTEGDITGQGPHFKSRKKYQEDQRISSLSCQ